MFRPAQSSKFVQVSRCPPLISYKTSKLLHFVVVWTENGVGYSFLWIYVGLAVSHAIMSARPAAQCLTPPYLTVIW